MDFGENDYLSQPRLLLATPFYIADFSKTNSVRVSGLSWRMRPGRSDKEAMSNEHGNTAKDGYVCKIEGRPMPLLDMEIEKIGDGTVPPAIQDVPDGTADNKTQRDAGDAACLLPQPP